LIVKELVRECFRLKERHHKLCSGPVRYHARRNRPVGLPIVVIVVKNSILRFSVNRRSNLGLTQSR
jgi:hypothetical protein